MQRRVALLDAGGQVHDCVLVPLEDFHLGDSGAATSTGNGNGREGCLSDVRAFPT